MLAKGNQQEVDKALKIIQNSIIGLVIVSVAYGLVNFTFMKLWDHVLPPS